MGVFTCDDEVAFGSDKPGEFLEPEDFSLR